MAETLTFDPTPADAPELNADEQDSLAVGEEMQEAQDNLLAGKYQNAQELESAYIELQRKLGNNNDEDDEYVDNGEDTDTSDQETVISFLNDASTEWYQNGELSAETVEGLSQMTSAELVDAYIEQQSNQQSPSYEMTDQDISSIKSLVGGEAEYDTLVSWASDNLDPSSIEGFDSLIETGNHKAIELAVAGLAAMYDAQFGSEGSMVTGRAPRSDGDSFKSQAEVVTAMSDPRYEKDPAYRQSIIDKLDRSENYF